MGAPELGMVAAEAPSAEALLSAFKTIDAAERRKHASLLNYWLSIRGDKEFPPLHDLDPLEISDAGPQSILLELIGGGHDAEVRHIGEALRSETRVEKIIEAPSPSVLASIAKKLPIVAISRDFLAFEDEYESPDGPTRCWVTLLPLSAGGAWVDYVYALVSLDGPEAKTKAAKPAEEAEPVEDLAEVGDLAETEETAEVEQAEAIAEEAPAEAAAEPVEPEAVDEPEAVENAEAPAAKTVPGFTKLFDSLVGLTNFYGSEPVKVEPVIDPAPVAEEQVAEHPVADQPVADEPVAEEPPIEQVAEELLADEQPVEQVAEEPLAEEQPVEQVAEVPVAEEAPLAPAVEELELAEQPQPTEQPSPAAEETLQSKLAEVRAIADEARQAKLRANAALYEGLGAAYDFALDAEEAPEEYLRLVEAEGLKLQLRSPMKPVAKLAFADMCDELTIKQLEAVLAWAFDNELPRGTLAERIHEAGGIARVLSGEASAA